VIETDTSSSEIEADSSSEDTDPVMRRCKTCFPEPGSSRSEEQGSRSERQRPPTPDWLRSFLEIKAQMRPPKWRMEQKIKTSIEIMERLYKKK
jgi:hypothetical protein